MKIRLQDTPEKLMASMNREMVPAGVWDLEVVDSKHEANQYKIHQNNPDGYAYCLTLRAMTCIDKPELSGGSYGFVFVTVGEHEQAKLVALASTIGVEAELVDGEWSLDLEPEDFAKKILRLRLHHYTSKAGKTSVQVQDFIPMPKFEAEETQAETKRAPARTQAAKAHREVTGGEPDAIPF